jgi:hypothetical protein
VQVRAQRGARIAAAAGGPSVAGAARGRGETTDDKVMEEDGDEDGDGDEDEDASAGLWSRVAEAAAASSPLLPELLPPLARRPALVLTVCDEGAATAMLRVDFDAVAGEVIDDIAAAVKGASLLAEIVAAAAPADAGAAATGDATVAAYLRDTADAGDV